MKQKKESYFWASYSDLMTSLFFIMLVLFILTIALLHKRMVATEKELNKIKEVQQATESIDPDYFVYREEYKKHILKISVQFRLNSSDINDIDIERQEQLKKAGESIANFINKNTTEDVQYLLIIEGQASLDMSSINYELSYERALALKKFWEEKGVNFGNKCEVLISGSGDGKLSGTDFMREEEEKKNQRFLIHIIPKFGTI